MAVAPPAGQAGPATQLSNLEAAFGGLYVGELRLLVNMTADGRMHGGASEATVKAVSAAEALPPALEHCSGVEIRAT